MPGGRFGASKFRNAVPHVPTREDWYRNALPTSASSSSTSSSTSTFSSEVKTSRQWVATLSQAGELSYRAYDTFGAYPKVGVVKGLGGGGGVGDWDLSRLEDGLMAVGGLDGSISVYALPRFSASPEPPSLIHTIPPNSSAITNIFLHPTTPSLILASRATLPLAIYDISSASASPVIELSAKEPNGMWSIIWSTDGKLVAGVGKSGTGYLWDPRAGGDPVISKALPIQPIKPAKIAFVGDDIFLTSFSKTRNRQYSLLSTSSGFTTTFTQTLDTSPGPLVPVIDQERRIVYLAGRGDMTLRQVELSGPNGFQETLHPLPHALTSSSIALAHPTTLPVMSAQIATVLLPVADKDGDALLPFGVRVPRRQLIDYPEDLYPEVVGTIPEQTAKDWLAKGDAKPLPISLDPARRNVWESRSYTQEAPDRQTTSTNVTDKMIPSPPLGTGQTSLNSTSVSAGAPSSTLPSEPNGAPVTIPSETSASASQRTSSDKNDPLALKSQETYASTSYKARIIGAHIVEQLEKHRKKGATGPLMVGLQGPQGCGKTTLCDTLVAYLAEPDRELKTAVLSLDDLYKTNAGLKALAQRHPNNHLLSGRGPPGTHDVDLATSTLSAVRSFDDDPTKILDLPIFDKSLCAGEGDRSEETVKVEGPVDVFVLEGWSMGFAPLPIEDLKKRYDESSRSGERSYYKSHSLDSLITINNYLSDFVRDVYPLFSTVIQVEPTTYKYVFKWRLQQEHMMKEKNGGRGMTDEQVHAFVERYMPGYELWKEGIWADNTPWVGNGLKLFFGEEREVLRILKPAASPGSAGAAANGMPPPTNEASHLPTSAVAPAGASSTTQARQELTNPAAGAPEPVSAASTLPTPSKPFNPTWSRKFLSAKSPLHPTYDQIPSPATLHQDSLVLKCTPTLAFFPVQGPGGRLGAHPLKRKGRVVLGGEGHLSGGMELADFAVEMFSGRDGSRVALAGDDGVIRLWRIGEDGIQGAGPEPEAVLKGNGVDKIAQLAFHPTAKDLLTAATNDHGKACIRFWDLSAAVEVKSVELDTSGVFNFTWVADGDRLAAATKDGRITVLDPRDLSSSVSGKAHDSQRSFQIAWIDSNHLISVGFSRGSQRKINLYLISPSEITTIHSLLIDVSPSVLFPVYDPDTAILYVWGKGERQIQAYEIHPKHETEPIAKLPSYTSGSPQLGVAFFPKRVVDVTKVEVMRALRLTAKTIEDVTFSIPRNKPEFFQDDIYAANIDVETPSMTAADWLKGSNTPPKRIDLKPSGMTSLSQAPQTTSIAKAKFVPATDIMSEEEKKRREMDRLFQKAKADESSDEEVATSGIDPPDDW